MEHRAFVRKRDSDAVRPTPAPRNSYAVAQIELVNGEGNASIFYGDHDSTYRHAMAPPVPALVQLTASTTPRTYVRTARVMGLCRSTTSWPAAGVDVFRLCFDSDGQSLPRRRSSFSAPCTAMPRIDRCGAYCRRREWERQGIKGAAHDHDGSPGNGPSCPHPRHGTAAS